MTVFRKAHLKELTRKSVRCFGFELVRLPVKGHKAMPMAEDVSDTLLSGSNAGTLPVEVPVTQLTWDNGFSLHPEGWNPYVETVRQFLSGGIKDYEGIGGYEGDGEGIKSDGDGGKKGLRGYEGSALQRFYDAFTPETAAEYFGVDFEERSPLRETLVDGYILPWSLLTPEQRRRQRKNQNSEEEQLAAGISRNRGQVSGLTRVGPISHTKGELEYRRLISLAKSVRDHGYRRHQNKDIEVVMLTQWPGVNRSRGQVKSQVKPQVKLQGSSQQRREDELLYVIISGFHRAAVLAALGYEFLPVVPKPPTVVDVELLRGAVAIRRGFWTMEDVSRYFEFLHRERGRGRAESLGLL